MLEQRHEDITVRLRAMIEDELGTFRRLANVPAAEIEEMAARLVRAIAPQVTASEAAGPASQAA